MSQSNHRLALAAAEDLAGKILDTLRPVCEPGYCVVAGSVRRRQPDVGDMEMVVIPAFSRGMFDQPGVSLLDLALVQMVNRGQLLRASKTPLEKLSIKSFYIPALFRQGHMNKLEIHTSDPERWPVELAIFTGSAEFSKSLVTWRKHGGRLPGHWRIDGGWKVWEGDKQLVFESERHFIEMICGAWIPPEKRD